MVFLLWFLDLTPTQKNMGRREVIIITSFTIRVQENVDEVVHPDYENEKKKEEFSICCISPYGNREKSSKSQEG